MDLVFFLIGAGCIMCVMLARHFIAGFPAQGPEDYADDLNVLDMRKDLDGEMVCEGVIFGPMGRVTSTFVADFNVHWDGDIATINEHFTYDDKSTQDRVWTIQMGESGNFTATAPDVPGVGKGCNSGATIQIRYPITLPEDVGGHTLQTVDWIYLTPEGTLINRSQFRKFGFKVAELVATIRKRETQ
jgi:hypothetical protein